MGHDEKVINDSGLSNEPVTDQSNGRTSTAPPSPPQPPASALTCQCSVKMDEESAGCTLRALEARIAEESTARIAAEVRAERAERRVSELQVSVNFRGDVDRPNNNIGLTVSEQGMEQRLQQFEGELRQANAWASRAEEMLRDREEKCGEGNNVKQMLSLESLQDGVRSLSLLLSSPMWKDPRPQTFSCTPDAP